MPIEVFTTILNDIQPGRLVESLVFLTVLWLKVRPHLKNIEQRMMGMEVGLNEMQKGLHKIENIMTDSIHVTEVHLDKMQAKVDALSTRVLALEKINGGK